MSAWRQIKLSVLLHAIDNDHSILLLHAPSGEYPTFRAIEDIPHSLFWGKREHLIIPIAGLRKCSILAFCYEHRLRARQRYFRCRCTAPWAIARNRL